MDTESKTPTLFEPKVTKDEDVEEKSHCDDFEVKPAVKGLMLQAPNQIPAPGLTMDAFKIPFASLERGKLQYRHLNYPKPRNQSLRDPVDDLKPVAYHKYVTFYQSLSQDGGKEEQLKTIDHELWSYFQSNNTEDAMVMWENLLQKVVCPAVVLALQQDSRFKARVILKSLIKQCRAFKETYSMIPKKVFLIDILDGESTGNISLRAAWDDSEEDDRFPNFVDTILSIGPDGLWYLSLCFQDGVNKVDRATMTYLSRFPEVRESVVSHLIAQEIRCVSSVERRECGVVAAAVLGRSLGPLVVKALEEALMKGTVNPRLAAWSLMSVGEEGRKVVLSLLARSAAPNMVSEDTKKAVAWSLGLGPADLAKGFLPKGATHVTGCWDYSRPCRGFSDPFLFDESVAVSKTASFESSTLRILGEAEDNVIEGVIRKVIGKCSCVWDTSDEFPHKLDCCVYDKDDEQEQFSYKRITVLINAHDFVSRFCKYQSEYKLPKTPKKKMGESNSTQCANTDGCETLKQKTSEGEALLRFNSVFPQEKALRSKYTAFTAQREASRENIMLELSQHRHKLRFFSQIAQNPFDIRINEPQGVASTRSSDSLPFDVLDRLTALYSAIQHTDASEIETLEGLFRSATRNIGWLATTLCELTSSSREPLACVLLQMGIRCCEQVIHSNLGGIEQRNTRCTTWLNADDDTQQSFNAGLLACCATLLGSLSLLDGLSESKSSHQKVNALFISLLKQEHFNVRFWTFLALRRWKTGLNQQVLELVCSKFWNAKNTRLTTSTFAASCLLFSSLQDMLISDLESISSGHRSLQGNITPVHAMVLVLGNLSRHELQQFSLESLQRMTLALVRLSQSGPLGTVNQGLCCARALQAVMRITGAFGEQVPFLRMRTMLPLCSMSLKHDCRTVRHSAARELASLGPEGELVLVHAVNDGETTRERVAALEGLRGLGPAATAETVVLSLLDSNHHVRNAARAAVVSWECLQWDRNLVGHKRELIANLVDRYLEENVGDSFPGEEFAVLTRLVSRLQL